MLEKLAKSIEEVNVLAEHYRTCQNVAAIETLQKRMFHIQSGHGCFYSGKKEVSAEGFVNQSVSVTEKLTEEMLLLQDSGYATVLGTYLLDLARKDPVMKDVILQPHKTLRHCIEYVHEKAYETALEKAKKEGKTGVGQNAGIAIGSTEVFAWVIDYYLLDDRKDMEKKAQEEKDTIKKAWKRERIQLGHCQQNQKMQIRRKMFRKRQRWQQSQQCKRKEEPGSFLYLI